MEDLQSSALPLGYAALLPLYAAGLTGLTGAETHAQGRSVGRAGAHAQGRFVERARVDVPNKKHDLVLFSSFNSTTIGLGLTTFVALFPS